MRCGREGQQDRRGPSEERRHRLREEVAHPAKIAIQSRAALELRESLRGERAAEEESEQEQRNAADLAAERGLLPIALVLARLW